jgi:sec-independent protein translocase protein TatA
MGPIGIPELLVILFIVILIFGASRLPELGKGIGQGIRNFKEATRDGAPEEVRVLHVFGTPVLDPERGPRIETWGPAGGARLNWSQVTGAGKELPTVTLEPCARPLNVPTMASVPSLLMSVMFVPPGGEVAPPP